MPVFAALHGYAGLAVRGMLPATVMRMLREHDEAAAP
jgi:hypothetical protein